MRGGMIEPWHDRKSFFKYYTADSAKLTLKKVSRKWSTPFLFNDPFDNQFDLHFEEPSEESAQEMIRQAHLRNPDIQYLLSPTVLWRGLVLNNFDFCS